MSKFLAELMTIHEEAINEIWDGWKDRLREAARHGAKGIQLSGSESRTLEKNSELRQLIGEAGLIMDVRKSGDAQVTWVLWKAN